jgi:hypothetical protein
MYKLLFAGSEAHQNANQPKGKPRNANYFDKKGYLICLKPISHGPSANDIHEVIKKSVD